jgi:3-deoxy-D-manno-octulosonate 8-phosphate phosphatase (KDO 8-P phosphatase)
MNVFTENITRFLATKGIALSEFLATHKVMQLTDLSLAQVKGFCQQHGISFENFMSYPHYLREQRENIKLLLIDVDGVMTDAGMYFTENGDQIKKYNAKDGMAIMRLREYGIQSGIISSGFKTKLVKDRADLLKIDHFYVGRGAKIDVLNEWVEKLGIQPSEIAMIGDDINDLAAMRQVGFSACPADAVDVVKNTVDVVLFKKGGEGCVRELIDHFLLDAPID